MQASDSDGPNIFERQVQQTDFHPTRQQSAAVMLMGRNSSDESQQRDEEDEDSSMLLLSSLPATVQGQQQQQNSLMTAATTTAKGGSGLLDSAARSAGLRRSLTLPRNPFSVSKRFVERKYLKILQASSHNTANIIQEPSCLLADSPVADSLKTNMAAGRSSSSAVKNFLARMVNQLSIVTTKRRFAAANAATAAAETNIVATVASVADSAGDAAWDPDERIREWKAYFESRAEVPGVIGIRNHGNTCFMNAILQCLSYTDLLAEYFVLDQYKADLKRRRRLLPFSAGGKTAAAAAANTGSGSGGRGELTEQLAVVLKSLWSLQYDPEISDKFKSLGRTA